MIDKKIFFFKLGNQSRQLFFWTIIVLERKKKGKIIEKKLSKTCYKKWRNKQKLICKKSYKEMGNKNSNKLLNITLDKASRQKKKFFWRKIIFNYSQLKVLIKCEHGIDIFIWAWFQSTAYRIPIHRNSWWMCPTKRRV